MHILCSASIQNPIIPIDLAKTGMEKETIKQNKIFFLNLLNFICTLSTYPFQCLYEISCICIEYI